MGERERTTGRWARQRRPDLTHRGVVQRLAVGLALGGRAERSADAFSSPLVIGDHDAARRNAVPGLVSGEQLTSHVDLRSD